MRDVVNVVWSNNQVMPMSWNYRVVQSEDGLRIYDVYYGNAVNQ